MLTKQEYPESSGILCSLRGEFGVSARPPGCRAARAGLPHEGDRELEKNALSAQFMELWDIIAFQENVVILRW